MAPHVLQLIHGGSVVRIFFKKLWRFFTEPYATRDETSEDVAHRNTW